MHLKASIGWGGLNIELLNADMDKIRELLFVEPLHRLIDSCDSNTEVAKNGWISVDDSLPEMAFPVLVSIPDKPYPLIATFVAVNSVGVPMSEGHWRFSDEIAPRGYVTHWQPLPEKAKGYPQ